ncbi:MAG: hypothetical protein QGG75_17130, partial [Alphaproteobacteria bacterium]|nr:hypothetical protein [Alphaproteobacteria bacterium]
NITAILRQAPRRAAAPAAKDTSDREPRQAAPRKFHSKYQQASGKRPALPESAANTALALRLQKAQNHLDKAAESLFRADLAATSSTTTQANELAKARAHLAEYDALAPSLAIPTAVRNPVLKNTSTVVLAHLGKMNRQVRHYLTTSEVLHRAALDNASPSAAQNAAHVLDGRLTRAGQKAVAARELVGLPYFQESDYFLALALTMMTEAGASLFEGLKSGDNTALVRNWAVDVRKRTLVGRRAVVQARRQEKKSNASLALIPDPGLKAKFAEFMRLGSRYKDLLDEALRDLEKASHDLEAGRLEADAVVAIDANFNFPLEPLLGRLSALTTELSRLQ